MIRHSGRPGRRCGRVGAATAVVALVAAVAVPSSSAGRAPVTASTDKTAATDNAAATDHAAPAGPWTGAWMGTAGTGPAASLADIRTIIGANTGTTSALTGAGVGIAMIDTGVAPVPGLPAAQIVNGPDLSFESQAPNLRYLDTYGHGTHMAGIIVGDDAATGVNGIAPKAKLTSIKIATANGASDVSQMIAALDWVVQHRNDDAANPIRVVNMSYGTDGHGWWWYDPLHVAVEKAWKAGIIVVAATGNDGDYNSQLLTNPATNPNIIAVGASRTNGTVATGDDDVATFTNLDRAGKGRDADVLAPGVSVQSLSNPNSNIDLSYPTARVGGTLFRGSGTSQATAVTSAAIALILQAKPTWGPDHVKQYLKKGGTLLTAGSAAGLTQRQLNVANTLAQTGWTASETAWNPAKKAAVLGGYSWIDETRGGSRLERDGVALTGENSIFGPWKSTDWAAKGNATWVGGVWMGYRMAGDGWTGTSWASKTWAAATWEAKPWNAATSWADPDWNGRYWSGRYWSGGAWNGRYWSSEDWSNAYWG